jgi:hypothetical protein
MATRVYKLTTQGDTTHNSTLWGPGVSHTTDGSGELCSNGWLHAYTHPLLAVLLNPMHADIRKPKLWLAYGSGKRKDDRGLKVGFTTLKTVKELPLPEITTVQRVAFAIYCALEVYKEPSFAQWAAKWLSGEDRSKDAAAYADAAYAAAYAAAAAEIDFVKLVNKAMRVR